ncbi:hypothetical protein J5A52_03735 [TM7 phylum sp. oral taxon 349]|nr:hypothetical protein J5A52_03735 [TM7 phylum sp. oral taxon 349]
MKQSKTANTTRVTSQIAPNPRMEQSYHVFMLPFIVKEDVSPKHLEERLSVYDTTKWIHVCDKVLSDEEEARKAYNASKYFNKAAFEALHQTTKPLHKSWRRQHKDDEFLEEFELKDLDPTRSYYRLDLNHFSARLQLQSVRVKLYSHNIGQIIYTTYYNEVLFQKDKERKTVENYSYLNAVEDINSCGRRVSLPFVPQPKQGSYADQLTATAVAAEISISINTESSHNTTSYKTDFDQMAKSIVPAGSTAHTYQENAHHTIAKHAVGIIFNSTIKEDKYHETIIPAYDDRMILASIISSDEAANLIPSYTEFKSLDEKTLSRISIYETEPDKAPCPNDMTAYKDARQLYGIISCDSHNDYTVRDASMLQKLMQKFSLDRWNEYKSYTGVSHHAFVMIKPPRDDNAFLFDNFLDLYAEMVSLVVAQRTALLNILHNTSEASRNIKSVHFPELQATSRVAKIRQDIAIFTANINLLDITEQEQGDETYTKIRENLGVNTLSHNVKEQVEELSDAAQAIRSSVYNAAALIVAVDALIIEIDIDKLWPNETIKVSIILVILIVYLISRYITTKKKY